LSGKVGGPTVALSKRDGFFTASTAGGSDQTVSACLRGFLVIRQASPTR